MRPKTVTKSIDFGLGPGPENRFPGKISSGFQSGARFSSYEAILSQVQCCLASSTSMPPRDRCKEVDHVAHLLMPFAHCPEFVVYFESIKAKLEKKRLLPYISLIKVVRHHYPKLTWSQGDMKKIAHKTAKLAADQWLRGLTKDELVDYAKRMGLRLRTLFYHARQAELKATKWLMKELNSDVSPSVDKAKEDEAEEAEGEGEDVEEEEAEDEGEEEEAEEAEEEEEAPPPPKLAAQKKPAAAQAEIEYFCGYDNEFRKAWRAPSSKPDARESCPNKLQIPDGAADSDHPVAVWDDMPKPVPITCLTVGQVKAMEADQKPKGVIWEHKFEDGRRLHVAARADRDHLVAV